MSPENTPYPQNQQPYSTPSTAPATTAPQAPQVNPNDLARAMDQAERKRGRRRLRRRALLAGGGVVAAAAVCGGAVEFGPGLLQKAGEYTKNELDQAFQSGIEAGRQAVLNELKQLEGISIEVAIDIADVEQSMFDKLIIPLAQLAVTVSGDVLAALASIVGTARGDLAHFNIDLGLLDSLQTLLNTWRDNLPNSAVLQAYASYNDSQIQASVTYLRALEARINAPQSTTPTPSK